MMVVAVVVVVVVMVVDVVAGSKSREVVMDSSIATHFCEGLIQFVGYGLVLLLLNDKVVCDGLLPRRVCGGGGNVLHILDIL